MRPGLVVQHSRLPNRNTGLVRSDIAAILGFVGKDRWPADASAGDFIELYLRRIHDFWDHPDRQLFDEPTQRAVKCFFENGGDICHVFGICVESSEDLRLPSGMMGVLTPTLDRLRAEEDIALLLAPSAAYMSCQVDKDGGVRADVEALYDELLAHCREMNNRFLIMDAPHGLHESLLERWVRGLRSRHPENRAFGAIYYPWLQSGDECFPPSGAVAGTFARVEIEHGAFGVMWPPANIPLRGVTHCEVGLTWAEAGAYADQAINPIITQSGRGVLIFGARTLSDQPQFHHINTRRVINMVHDQLRRDSEWSVFETNNPHLWDVLDRDIRYRLEEFSEAGALIAKGDESQYQVVCNRSINTNRTRDAGQVNVEVMLRPVGTTEHVLIDLCIGGNA
ncbi:MAG: phage tail sheath family protein [Deltaproteobacteria bacterium]|nr:phage tail sheath family protein [Deltaproteobacteria bacterium]